MPENGIKNTKVRRNDRDMIDLEKTVQGIRLVCRVAEAKASVFSLLPIWLLNLNSEGCTFIRATGSKKVQSPGRAANTAGVFFSAVIEPTRRCPSIAPGLRWLCSGRGSAFWMVQLSPNPHDRGRARRWKRRRRSRDWKRQRGRDRSF